MTHSPHCCSVSCVVALSDAPRTTNGFRAIHQAEPITHLMFVEDLKVYAEDRIGLEEAVRMVEEVLGAMGMELGLRKCVVAHMRQGTMVMSGGGGGITLKSGKELSELEEGVVYRYLGVSQRFGADLTRTKQGVEREYIARPVTCGDR